MGLELLGYRSRDCRISYFWEKAALHGLGVGLVWSSSRMSNSFKG